jgi:formylglycine-generating enzyme required for sulfatase activity
MALHLVRGLIWSSILTVTAYAGNGYVTVITPAAPLLDGGTRVGIAGKAVSFEVLTPTEKTYVIQIKSWSRTIYPVVPKRFVEFSNEKPGKIVRSLQQLAIVCPVTDEMKAFVDEAMGEKVATPATSGAAPPASSKTPSGASTTPTQPPGEVRLPEGLVRKGKRLTWVKDGTEMVEVPDGEFLCGKNREKIHVPRLFIDRFEATNAQYHKFVEETGRPNPPYWAGTAAKRFADPNQPVVGVRYEDAAAYAQWAGKRLPTGIEWEKAARGTDGRAYPWGDTPPDGALARFQEDAKVGTPAKVGKYPKGKSPFGACDMAGNVAEWVDEWFDAERTYRVIRGGSWYDSGQYLRVFSREDRLPTDSGIAWGFRCVVDGD